MSQSNLLPDTDCDSLHKFKAVRALHLTAAVAVTAVMLTMIMMVTPILINGNYYSQSYCEECADEGNDSDQWSVLVAMMEMMMMMMYVHANHDEFIEKIAPGGWILTCAIEVHYMISRV